MTYRLLVDFEVIEYLNHLPKAQRQRLFDRLRQIRDFPGRFSDYREPDAEGRQIDVHICGRYAVKYWDDVNDRHVKILDIHLADRLG